MLVEKQEDVWIEAHLALDLVEGDEEIGKEPDGRGFLNQKIN